MNSSQNKLHRGLRDLMRTARHQLFDCEGRDDSSTNAYLHKFRINALVEKMASGNKG